MNITDAWLDGSKTCFMKLLSALGGKRDQTAFFGIPPELLSTVEIPEAWSFTSGGQGTEPISRLWGAQAAWCTLSFNARTIVQGETPEQCMGMAGKVLGFLKDTNNMHNIGNVQWLRVTDMPKEPTFQPIALQNGTTNRVLWQVEISMEMVIATETEFDA